MLLIYSPINTPRLQYICNFIFSFLEITFSISTRPDDVITHNGPIINYSSNQNLPGLHIYLSGLLQQEGIRKQDIKAGTHENFPLIFSTEQGKLPFDIFSAVFFLITRYEEYLPYTPDEYGRFHFKDSTAYKLGFLNRPLINEWMIWFGSELKKLYPQLQISVPEFSFLPTYDIDMAWSYRQKGLLRNLGGMIKKPSAERIAVLANIIADPFDAYRWLHKLHEAHQLNPIYFFLVADKISRYDKNTSPSNSAFRNLIRQHHSHYTVGLHPSWQSNNNPRVFKQEADTLRGLINHTITASRQHYIKMQMPETYRMLIENEITNDYSMGYGSINGFRASVARPFKWYDLKKEKVQPLHIHPFCFMDANSYYEQQQTIEETEAELQHYLKTCRETGGELISIFHNSFLGSGKAFKGWRELYTDFVKQAVENGSKQDLKL